MSYVVAVIVPEGIVAMADTRITTGTEKRSNQKFWISNDKRYFALFAGNRYWTDEILRAFDARTDWSEIDTVYALASWLGHEAIRIRERNLDLLNKSPLEFSFDLGLIVGGRGPADTRQDIRDVYRAGNHVTFSELTPYHFSGATSYGKFILDDGIAARTLRQGQDLTLREAVAAVLLSMHATQSSTTTVDYPMHLLVWPASAAEPEVHLIKQSGLSAFRRSFRDHLATFLKDAPLPWSQ
jgi:putative proteasome-type protease